MSICLYGGTFDPPHVIVFVEGGLVQGAKSTSKHVTIDVIDMDAEKSGDMYEDEAERTAKL